MVIVNVIAIRSVAEVTELLTSLKDHEAAAYIAACEPAPLPATVLVSLPDTTDQAMEIADTLIRTGALELVAIDATLCAGPAFARLLGEARKRDSGLVLVYP